MSKRKKLERLNLALAAALMLASTNQFSMAQSTDNLRGTVTDIRGCNDDLSGSNTGNNSGDDDGNNGCGFRIGSEGV